MNKTTSMILDKKVSRDQFVAEVIAAARRVEAGARNRTLHQLDAEKAFDLAQKYVYTRVYSSEGFTPWQWGPNFITRVTVVRGKLGYEVIVGRVSSARKNNRGDLVITK